MRRFFRYGNFRGGTLHSAHITPSSCTSYVAFSHFRPCWPAALGTVELSRPISPARAERLKLARGTHYLYAHCASAEP